MSLANALAVTSGILWIVCSILIWLVPEFSLSATRWWFMGLDIGALGHFNLDANIFLLGGLSTVVSTWIVGYVLGWLLEVFGGKA